jgi:hypothetical protein
MVLPRNESLVCWEKEEEDVSVSDICVVVPSVMAVRSLQGSCCTFEWQKLVVIGTNARLCGERTKIMSTIPHEGTTSRDVATFVRPSFSNNSNNCEGSFTVYISHTPSAPQSTTHFQITINPPNLHSQNKGSRFMNRKTRMMLLFAGADCTKWHHRNLPYHRPP